MVSKTLDDVVTELEAIREAVADLEVIREVVVDLKASQISGQVFKEELGAIRTQQAADERAVTTLVTQLSETRAMELRLRAVEERLGIHQH